MKSIFRCFCILYLIMLFYIVFLARRRRKVNLQISQRINLIPVKSKFENFQFHNLNHPKELYVFVSDIIGNILLFIPLPICLILLFGRINQNKLISIAAITSFTIELIQFIFDIGVADIDDIILNVLGAVIGVIIMNSFNNKKWAKKI